MDRKGRRFFGLLCCLASMLWMPGKAQVAVPDGGSGRLQQALEELLGSSGVESAAVGISVRRVSDGREVLSFRPEMSLVPASTAKLLPTWLALQECGPDRVWRTEVRYRGRISGDCLEGDLVVCAGGDPTLDSRFFPNHSLLPALVEALRKKGVARIAGQILLQGGRRGEDIPGSWPWEDVSNYYAAPYLPFNYRDNMFTLRFRTGKAGTPARLLAADPEPAGFRIRNEAVAYSGSGDRSWIFGGPFSDVLCVRGEIPADRALFCVKGVLHDPVPTFVRELAKGLEKAGIRISGGDCGADAALQPLLVLSSPALREVVHRTNKSSVNLFAEALGNLAAGGRWTEKAGEMLVRAGLDTGGLILKDACGLSPGNAIPARLLTDLLVHAAGRDKGGCFRNSLPLAGTDGGLGNYCSSAPVLKGRLQAKTGSMSGVRCLAGYLTRRNGECLAFAVMVNHFTCTPSRLQQRIGRLLGILAE